MRGNMYIWIDKCHPYEYRGHMLNHRKMTEEISERKITS